MLCWKPKTPENLRVSYVTNPENSPSKTVALSTAPRHNAKASTFTPRF